MELDRDIVSVRDTAVGNGIFARGGIDVNELVAEVRGEIVDDPDYESDYCIDLEEDAKLEPREPFRFLNHRCEPNCELVLWKTRRYGDREYPGVWLQAISRIEAGDELTIDYAWPAEAAIPCKCTSERCRSWIVRQDELRMLS